METEPGLNIDTGQRHGRIGSNVLFRLLWTRAVDQLKHSLVLLLFTPHASSRSWPHNVHANQLSALQ